MTEHDLLVPFTRPSINTEVINEYARLAKTALESGRITAGQYVRDFEKRIQKRLDVKYVIAVNSGTAALHAAVRTLNLNQGDDILVTADTFVSSANAIVYEGLKPRFVDVDAHTFNISPESLIERITPRSKAVMVVHLGGVPCDMKAILSIARDLHLAVVEDAAQAFGATYHGKLCGTFGEAGAISFDHAKLITTAEGGAVLTNRGRVASEARKFSNLGRTRLGYEAVDSIGYNYRLSELHAALGLVSEKRYEGNLRNRISAGRRYRSLLSKLDWVDMQGLDSQTEPSYHATIIRLKKDAPVTRNLLMKKLANKGIGTSILFKPVHLQPVYRQMLGDTKGTCPNAEQLGESGLALPMFNDITAAQVDNVVKAMEQIARE